MKKEFEILKITRGNILKAVQNLSDEQLIKIPQGFNNNILWNVGHIVSSGQKLTYGLSNIPMKVSEDYPTIFGKGTDPKKWSSTPDIGEIKGHLISTPALLEEDYKQGIFKEYKEYPTSYGFTICNIEDAIAFCNIHEALHFGVIMAMRKLV